MWRSKTCRLVQISMGHIHSHGVSRDIINTTDSNEANVSWQPEFHSRREDFRWKVGDVGRDRPASQELSHLVGESVAVVLKQTIPVTSEQQQQKNSVTCKVQIINLTISWLYITYVRSLELFCMRERNWPVCAFSQGREVIHEDLLRDFSLTELHHCVRRPQHSPTLPKTKKMCHKTETWLKSKSVMVWGSCCTISFYCFNFIMHV